MQKESEVCVLRLGHRPGRDERMTSHVGLTARALGADRVVFAGSAEDSRQTVEGVTDRFGGPFETEMSESYRPLLRKWAGSVVHLTMYGVPIQEIENEIKTIHRTEPLLVVVGAEKVSFDVYEAADYNVAVTNQPHSEVASLAVFLDRIFEGRELDREWDSAKRTVVPQERGKRVESTEREE